MHNKLKGEVLIEISGEQYPLVFSFNAIAKIESHYDETLLTAQEDLTRIDKVYRFLEASLNGKFTLEELAEKELPPVLKIIGLVRQSLQLAYFGNTTPEDDKEEKPTKKKKK